MVVLVDEEVDFSLLAGIEVEEQEQFLEEGLVKRPQLVGVVLVVDGGHRVLPELVVQAQVPPQTVHRLNNNTLTQHTPHCTPR